MSFYQIQGTLPLNAPSYVERQTDRVFLKALTEGAFSYILTSRQMGKSSLMVRTAQRLRELGHHVATLDLQGVGMNLTPEQWYGGLVVKIGMQLGLEGQLEDFWLDNERIGPVQRLFTALCELVLPSLPPPEGDRHPAVPRLIILIDEIDLVRSLPFSADEFFAAIRACYNRRTEDPVLNRLTFALLGAATQSELIRDPSVTLFHLGRSIELTDFTPQEAPVLARGLGRPEREAGVLLNRVLHWTHGHPYLTQRLCQAVAANPLLKSSGDIDRLSEELFLGRRACEQDENLLFVRERLVRSGPQRIDVLRLYEQIHSRHNIPDDETNPLVHALLVSGVVRRENGLLIVRNRIYFHVFNKEWIHQTIETLGGSELTALAVLPFHDTSAQDNEYLADGLTDELINALGQIPGLRVASRASSSQFKGKAIDVRQIGTQLGVSIILEGNVRQLGSRARVATQLISAVDGQRLWSGEFKYSVDDVHLIQEEVARAIVQQLRSRLGHEPPPSRRVTQTPNREAYHLYLKGRFYWNKRNEASIARSVTFFEQAVLKDPEYATAFAGLAEAYLILGIYNFRPPHDVHPRAKAAAIRALEIDDNLADAHCAMGCLYAVYDWDWVRSKTSFRRAISLNPNHANAHLWYGINCLTPLGRHDESLAELRIAQELDPLSIRISASIGLAYHLGGRHDDAIAQCKYTIELDDTFWLTYLFLGSVYMETGRLDDAHHTLQAAVDLSQGNAGVLAALAQCNALLGRQAEAERLLNGLLNLNRARYVPASEIASVYSSLKQMDLARQWLQKAHEERSFRLIYLRVDPRFGELRSEA